MIDWKSVEAADCAVPADRPMDDLVRELSRALADPDPLVRDGAPHTVLRPTSELPAQPLHHRDAFKSAIATVLDRIVRR
ncbi:hypothetical protein [Streptomyces sp. ML-6]|uniref:hypothetical protein n=1 Tax=Streptomyces sp. ML-6 TaxID=2982693 RepID=UPI0024BF1796|nr:hypothetical protein [Streptomyces sp. ML-6]MDK0524530.1 hypothetical protein [Streptomyces sp. ML-6]